MKDINRVVLCGRVTRDIQGRDYSATESGLARLSFSIAVHSPAKQPDGGWGDEASFFDVVAWGRLADALRDCMGKGERVIVDGRLKQEKWQDKNTGESRSAVRVIADNVQRLGGAESGSDEGWQEMPF